MVNDIAKIRP